MSGNCFRVNLIFCHRSLIAINVHDILHYDVILWFFTGHLILVYFKSPCTDFTVSVFQIKFLLLLTLETKSGKGINT